MLGTVRCRRAYSHCGQCGHGLVPWDSLVGLTARAFTPGCEQLISMAGTLGEGFGQAAEKILPRMAGIRVSESTVLRTTEAVGERIGRHLEAGGTFGFPKHWD